MLGSCFDLIPNTEQALGYLRSQETEKKRHFKQFGAFLGVFSISRPIIPGRTRRGKNRGLQNIPDFLILYRGTELIGYVYDPPYRGHHSHNNGTEWAFYSDPSVFFFSTHILYGYPGTGHPDKRGEGPGKGYNQEGLAKTRRHMWKRC
jgi:hypothetical protein